MAPHTPPTAGTKHPAHAPHDGPLALTIARRLEALVEASGRLVAWLVVAIVLLVTWDVTARYVLHRGSVALQELEWHLFAAVFLLGAAYTLKHDAHVRVDLFYRAAWMGPKGRALIDLTGTLLFLVPFTVLVIVQSWPFVLMAYTFGEGSPDPGGLGQRWLIKAVIPAGFGLLLLQATANALRAGCVLAGYPAATGDR